MSLAAGRLAGLHHTINGMASLKLCLVLDHNSTPMVRDARGGLSSLTGYGLTAETAYQSCTYISYVGRLGGGTYHRAIGIQGGST